MRCNSQLPKCSTLWHADQFKICFWGVILQNSARYLQKSNIDVICNRKCCKDMFHEKGWMKCNSQLPKCSTLWHADQFEICFWRVILQNSARYLQKSNIDVICNRKFCKDMFHDKVEWNPTLVNWNLLDFDMLTNWRSVFGASIRNTQRDIRKNQILTSFAIENVAKTCFMKKLNEMQLSTTQM